VTRMEGPPLSGPGACTKPSCRSLPHLVIGTSNGLRHSAGSSMNSPVENAAQSNRLTITRELQTPKKET